MVVMAKILLPFIFMAIVTEPGGYEKNYEYDPSTGDVSKVVDNAGGITTYEYDKMHRLLPETDVQVM